MTGTRALAVAVLLLGGCAVTVQPPTETPSRSASAERAPAGDLDAAAAEPPTADRPPASGGPGAAVVPPPPSAPVPVAVRDATGVPAAPTRTAPVRLVYEALGVDIPVDAVGVAPDGQMEIPEDAARAGWYRHGPGLDAGSGTAVLAAHAGSHVTPRGPLYDLPDARPGDVVVLTGNDGSEVRYEVETVEQTTKTVIDWSAYFRRDGEPRLVLVTCGGEWDAQRQSYDDNVTVTARLLGS